MWWNKFRRLSLKTRLAVSYAVCFAISCTGIFALALYLLDRVFNEIYDSRCRSLVEQVTGTYLLGTRYLRLREIVPAEKLPESTREAIFSKYPNAEILLSYFTPDTSAEFCTSCIAFRQNFYEVRTRDQQVIYSRQINIAANLPAMHNFCDKMFSANGRRNLWISVLNPDGGDLVNPKSAVGKQLIPHFQTGKNPVAFEQSRLRCFGKLLPDHRVIVVGWNTASRNLLIGRGIIIFGVIVVVVATLGMAVTFLLTRHFIRGIRATTLAMKEISAGDYSYRIGITDSDREILELMETFNSANARTEALLREMKTMSDNVAHDLRTPLTRISGTVELLLRDRNLEEKVRNVCVSIAEETLRLTEMVNTMMDISRTTAQPDALNREAVDLNAMIADFYEFMAPAFEEKSLLFKLELPPEPVIVSADRVKLQRLLANLLENALKFTDAGAVTISLRRENDRWQLKISDTGCGIDPADQAQIFRRFYRADRSRHRPGNGLGLALVEAIIKAHGWSIALESAPGVGSTFIITMA